jgi:PAS domain S-box-containing protein
MEKIINIFKNFPIERKINFAILGTCVTALSVTAVAIFYVQLVTFQHGFKRDIETLGHMISQTLTASITFQDRRGAAEILAAVNAKPQIVRAAVDLPNGTEFAAYSTPQSNDAPPAPKEDGFHSDGPYLVLNQPVLLAGERIATLRLLCDYQTEYYRSLRLYATIMGSVLLVSVVLAMVLSNRLQRLISDPILRLAGTARTIAEQQDYTIRAPASFRDEVGELTAAFNQMLTRIHAQDEALTFSQRKLEALINSIDGIVWERSPGDFRFTFVSQQSEPLLGYLPDQWLASADFWRRHLHPDDAERAVQTAKDAVDRRQPYHQEYRITATDGRAVWLRESGIVLVEHDKPAVVRGIFTDITAQKAAAEQLDKLNRKLMETSRQAGMSEVATGVLHNVGNVLNSVNVSVSVINELLGQSQSANLAKISSLLEAHREDLGEFLTLDSKGRRIPEFLAHLSSCQEEERTQIVHEMQTVQQNIEHIKEIVAMQQSYARVAGINEDLSPASLVEDAIRMNEGAFLRHGVQLKREFNPVPLVRVDKHKVLQVLVNLFRNAKYAMDATGRSDKLLTVGVSMNGGGRVRVMVHDNGIGIAAENLTRIFAHGFTTKKDGHGFGLHSGANAAKEMGGVLYAESDGLGKGAAFILELPIASDNPKPDNRDDHENKA